MGVDPRYVLHEMEPWEAAALLRNRDIATRDDWERTRVLAYLIAQACSTRRLRPDEVLPLPWDDDPGPAGDTPRDTPEDLARLAEMALRMQKQMQNGR